MLKVKPVALAIGTVVVASLGAGISASASDSVFATTDLSQGYNVLAAAEGEGKCGEGKCGEGKCGEDKEGEGDGAAADGAGHDGEGKDGEGKCGEGKCGGNG